jgi:peptide/nickel transport system permease protein
MQFMEYGGLDKPGDYTPIILMDTEQESQLQQLGQLELYWYRFRTHKLAILGTGMFLLLVLMAVFAPLITPGTTPATFNLDLGFGNHGPTLDHFPVGAFGYTGSDDLQRSVLTDVAYGARLSLFIGFVTAFATSLVGTAIGAVSGYFSGWVDNLIMRITDIFLTIPFLPLVIAISAIYSQGSGNVALIIIIFTVTGWPGIARLVRALFLSLREQEFAEAAKAVGVNDWRIIFRHLLPNALSPVIVATTLGIGGVIIGESVLDFLQVGIDPRIPTWGNVLANSQGDIITGNWWWPFFPGLFIVLTVLAINFIGDGLRDALDVRTRVE